MKPMSATDATHAAHATPVTAHPTDVTSAVSEATAMTAAETTAMTAAEATAMTAAAPATSTSRAYQQTARCIKVGAVGMAHLSERCRGRKSKRKSADDTKRDDAAIHDYTTPGEFIAPRKQ
jgi:hypothetical protein